MRIEQVDYLKSANRVKIVAYQKTWDHNQNENTVVTVIMKCRFVDYVFNACNGDKECQKVNQRGDFSFPEQ